MPFSIGAEIESLRLENHNYRELTNSLIYVRDELMEQNKIMREALEAIAEIHPEFKNDPVHYKEALAKEALEACGVSTKDKE